MDKLTNFLNQHYDQAMDWYQALTNLEQLGVLYGLFLAAFGIVAFYVIRK